VIVLLVTLVATGCTGTSNPIAKSSPAVSPGGLTWTDCGGGFQCATLQVPLDYSNPTSSTIGIAIDRKPATDQAHRIGSVLINPGGPGASGVQFAKDDASALTNLNRRFDLVGFDPRGVGQSSPVHCLDNAQKDAFIALDPMLDDPAEKQAGIQADKDFAAACELHSGKILPFLDTPSAAKDMDAIRAALGDAKLTYIGFSYGTFLGQTYAHLFPNHVRALVLDGVVDPALSANDLLTAEVVGFQNNLEAFLADCNARRSGSNPCRYAQSGDPATKLTALVHRLDSAPIPAGSRSLTLGLASSGIITGLYYQELWPALDAGLTAADGGNGTVLASIADILNERNPDGTYTNALDALEAVDCLDRPVPTDIAYYDALGPVFSKISPLLGPWLQYSNLGCAYWPVKPTGAPGPLSADGAPPILVVGGTNDPVTPYAWAQSVQRQLAGSVLLTRQGNGHTSSNDPCSAAAEDAYLINLTLPAVGTICQ
jgi:pimeloyl-ACP methyl ester carboxylesterase